MKKYLVTALITSIVMIAAIGGAIVLLSKENDKYEDKKKEAVEELGLLSNEKKMVNKADVMELFLSGKETNVLTYGAKSPDEIYDPVKSAAIKEDLEKKKRKGDYSFEAALWADNPFGTNQLSMYLYFQTKEASYLNYSICVDDEAIPDFTRILYNGREENLTRDHEYQLTGFVPGMDNYINLRLYNSKDRLIKEKTYLLRKPSVDASFPVKLTVSEGKSKGRDTLTNGLFFLLGHEGDKDKLPKDILFYDNSGILRGDIPLKDYRSDRIEFITNNMLYSYGKSQLAMVSPLGQVMKTYDLGKYVQHHDFLYNGYGQLWILATDTEKKSKTVQDVVVSLDIKTGKVKKLLDFETLLKGMKEKAKKVKGEKSLDWIHLNSITMTGTNDIVVSSRELSSIIKVSEVNSKNPKLGYIISEDMVWKGSSYQDLLLQKSAKETEEAVPTETPDVEIESIFDQGKKEVPFISQCGQYSVFFEEGTNLEEGQYYLSLFNNNYGSSDTRPDLKWSKIEDVGTKKKNARNSLFYKYMVDENLRTVTLDESIRVPYSSTAGSAQSVEGHRVIHSGMANAFLEYDRAGNLLFEYGYPQKINTCRVFKYNMKPFWFL